MDEIKSVKQWLGNGSINIFGLPFSGKDTVGRSLAELLNAEFISSGELLRQAGDKTQTTGKLSPTNVFYDVVLPYFDRAEIAGKPLVLSSIGRWHGEEQRVIAAAADGDHPIRTVLMINITEDEIYKRFDAAKTIGDRDGRHDDDRTLIQTRIAEFNNKTLPVIEAYRDMGLLIEINGEQSREAVMAETITKLAEFATRN